jgi:hypothetical protein
MVDEGAAVYRDQSVVKVAAEAPTTTAEMRRVGFVDS